LASPAHKRTQQPSSTAFRIAPAEGKGQRRHLLLNLPIAWRLGLGFLLAATIAAAAAGITGLRQSQALASQTRFYQNLLAANSQLSNGDTFLQLMNTKLGDTLADATVPNPSAETLATDKAALQGLADRYNAILANYVRNQLYIQHPEDMALLTAGGHALLLTQQQSLVASAARTWQVYQAAQTQLIQAVTAGNTATAATLLRAQAEPTNADAHSAMSALVQFNGRVAASVDDAALVEQHALVVTALIAALLAVVSIGLVGWVISNTLVRRLTLLRRVTLAVEDGDLDTRVEVMGKDEIAHVSAAVNGMLDAIVGLLDVTRRQRDALVNAAERLFADVRVAGSGDLRVNAAVSSDPIGMLGNAFNLTIGRFRRFVVRTQSAQEQLEVLARHGLDHTEAFLRLVADSPTVPPPSSPSRTSVGSEPALQWRQRGYIPAAPATPLPQLADRARELMRQQRGRDERQPWHGALEFAEQLYLSVGRLSQLTLAANAALEQRSARDVDVALRVQMEEMRMMSRTLAALAALARQAHQHAMATHPQVEEALDQLVFAAHTATLPTPTPPTRSAYSSWPVESSAAPMPPEDIVQQATIFAQDMSAFARQLLRITHEMRASAAPFKRQPVQEDSDLSIPGLDPASGPFSESAPGGRMRLLIE
jgi:methyl-accepting chemotaxis protein